MKKLHKLLPVIALVSVLAATAIPGTLSFLWGRTEQVTNTFYPDPAAVVAPAGKEEIKTLPQTGDASNLALWAALLLCGAGGAVWLYKKRS